MDNSSVLITGSGVISAAGNSIKQTLHAFSTMKRNVRKVSLFDTSLQVPVFEVDGITCSSGEKSMRTLTLTACAVEQALTDAKLNRKSLQTARVGISLGTTVACQLNDLDFYTAYRNNKTVPVDSVDRFLKGNLSEAIGVIIGTDGPFLTVVNACSSGADAIGIALSWLENDICDIAVAGGGDELNLIPLCGFNSLGVVSDEACKPFDRDRDGLNLGEGAGVVILETESSARKRKVSSNLEITGFGSAADAYHLTAPRPDGRGLENAVQQALSRSEIEPGEISFINAHGTATPSNDKVEGNVLSRIFGEGVKVISTKGFTGHTLGAAGGIEAVFTAAQLLEGWIPGTCGFTNKDDEIPLIPVSEKTEINGSYAMSTSLAFGGNNSALVLRRFS